MRTLKEIREARAAKVAEARALVTTAEQASRQLTADEQGKFANLQAEITNLESDEQRQQFLDDAERRSQARPVHTPNGSDTESRVSLLAVVRAGMEGRSLTGAEAEMHAELERRHGPARNGGILVPLSAFERRANTTATAPELVATQHRADQYIGPLSDSLLVRSLGVRTLTGLTGNVSIPKAGAGLTAGWVTEGQELPESQMDFDSVTLTPKHVGGITEMSRQL
ncbi:MAG: phage major capsid protein, partial [Xanthomonas perforans]|nr:phage major capsid protein [Xanthomonas perforans]